MWNPTRKVRMQLAQESGVLPTTESVVDQNDRRTMPNGTFGKEIRFGRVMPSGYGKGLSCNVRRATSAVAGARDEIVLKLQLLIV